MSQRSVNRSRDAGPELNGHELAIQECVRYVLSCTGGKVPIKHADISKHLSTVCQTASNQVAVVVNEANKVLKTVYGCELSKVDTRTGKQYIVVLTKENDSILPSIVNDCHRRLLIAALMHIFMTGAPVSEEDMWQFLMKAGLMGEDDHATRKLLTSNFTRQLYLEHTKVKVSDAAGNVTKNEFKWGQRAEKEMPKLFLLNKMAEAFGKTPDHWGEQYREATQEINQ